MPLLVKDKTALLFVHVPKTAGTSVYTYFKTQGWKVEDFDRRYRSNKFRVCPPQHYHREILELLYKFDRISGILQFTRDPIDRLVSEYFYRNKKNSSLFSQQKHFERWWRAVRSDFSRDPFTLDNHIRPQSDFLLPKSTIARFEDDLSAGFFEGYLAKLRQPVHSSEFPAENISRRRELTISNEINEEIREFYRDDFTNFGY